MKSQQAEIKRREKENDREMDLFLGRSTRPENFIAQRFMSVETKSIFHFRRFLLRKL